MRILILGGDGMLGHKVFQVLSDRFDTFATFRTANGPWNNFPVYSGCNRKRAIVGVDAMDFTSVEKAVRINRPDAVINCIGIIKQVKESGVPLISIAVNSLFPHQLAELCISKKIRMFHMSTDCVFSGRKGNYTEEDIPDAEDIYGRTKYLGEVNRPGCLTVRSSLIGRDFIKDVGLLEWFIGQRGRKIRGYTKVIYAGLTTLAMSRMIGDLIDGYPGLSGLYNIASDPINKYELLVKIRDSMKLDIEIEPYDGVSKDLSLNSSRFFRDTGYRAPSWDEMISDLANDKTPYERSVR
jgi:dTDP-4-dehydrorhamnose reductase